MVEAAPKVLEEDARKADCTTSSSECRAQPKLTHLPRKTASHETRLFKIAPHASELNAFASLMALSCLVGERVCMCMWQSHMLCVPMSSCVFSRNKVWGTLQYAFLRYGPRCRHQNFMIISVN